MDQKLLFGICYLVAIYPFETVIHVVILSSRDIPSAKQLSLPLSSGMTNFVR